MTNFASANSIAEIAAVMGDAARANMLCELMGGRALTAGELAHCAGITAQTASGHLAKLSDAGFVLPEKQGRHRYFRLASAEIASAIEALSALAAAGPRRHRPTGPRDVAMRRIRTCYDHMAGGLAVALTDRLVEKGLLRLGEGAGMVTDEGQRFFCDFGIDTTDDGKSRRPLCRTCLDWSERRYHIGGRLGADMLRRANELDWLKRKPDSRALALTRKGQAGFAEVFGVSRDLLDLGPHAERR
jgi:DNA-binding transcriptional ArsR family regulator